MSLKEASGHSILGVVLSDFDEEEIKNFIGQGFHAKVEYQIMGYRYLAGPSSLFGDELLFEDHPSFTGSWDVFSKSYEIRSENGIRVYCPAWEDFSRLFFRLEDFTLSHYRKTVDPVYILVQAKLRKIVLSSPMNVLTVFYDHNSQSTPWKRLELGK